MYFFLIAVLVGFVLYLYIRGRKDSLTHISQPINSGGGGTGGSGYDSPDTELTDPAEDEVRPH